MTLRLIWSVSLSILSGITVEMSPPVLRDTVPISFVPLLRSGVNVASMVHCGPTFRLKAASKRLRVV